MCDIIDTQQCTTTIENTSHLWALITSLSTSMCERDLHTAQRLSSHIRSDMLKMQIDHGTNLVFVCLQQHTN
jgi:hypothetical protein